MKGNDHSDILNFCIAGINYKKTDASLRGQFAIGAEQYEAVLESAAAFGLHEVFILSTCNRTEIYGITDNVQHMVHALCQQTEGSVEAFNEMAYIKKGTEAVEHFFNVDKPICGRQTARQGHKLASAFRAARFHMLKEIYEQPRSIAAALEPHDGNHRIVAFDVEGTQVANLRVVADIGFILQVRDVDGNAAFFLFRSIIDRREDHWRPSGFCRESQLIIV